MKHVIILGDGMADHVVSSLGNRTPLQAANTPSMDWLARNGRNGRLVTVPEGFPPGSEVANTSILGYDMNEVYEGRGPLEAASIGYEMQPGDLAIRCNIITLDDGKIINHHGGNLATEESRILIDYLNEHLANERVQFITGIQYRNLLVIKGGDKRVKCAPPHDFPGHEWRSLLPQAEVPEAEDTASLFRDLILRSQELLACHPLNQHRVAEGRLPANSIWMWSGGYRPSMLTLSAQFPEINKGSVISAVDLIRGIGHYAGLKVIEVEGATGLWDTNYEGKAQAAINALESGDDFVFVHVEASDEAGHDGDIALKVRTIENLDSRLVKPLMEYVNNSSEPISIALLPDHPTPVELRTHINEAVPFVIWHRGIEPDEVQQYDEFSCGNGAYGLLRLRQFIQTFMKA